MKTWLRRLVSLSALVAATGCASLQPTGIASDGITMRPDASPAPQRPMWLDPSYRPQHPTHQRIGLPVSPWVGGPFWKCVGVTLFPPSPLLHCVIL